MQRSLNVETLKKLGKRVRVCGWVNSIRSHGKILFVDLRDRSGLLQAILGTEGRELKPEWVVELTGTIKKRPKGMANAEIETGKVELVVENLKVLSKSKTPPFEITADSRKINEETRLKYRYLDLRTERMKKNLILRHKVVKFMRDFMDENGFIEIETPLLTKSTPEGARDFIVPSRLHPGKFYALPQSPQQYKQLLMVGGVEKYFQIVKCLRDEDPRADRQAEFTQLDMEMSFVEQEDILKLTEKLMNGIAKLIGRKVTWHRLTYAQALKKHKTDKPDLQRNKDELAFCWILDWPLFDWNKEEKRWDPMHHIFTAPQDPNFKDPKTAKSWQHDLVLNGYEIGGGSLRIHTRELQEKIFELVGIPAKESKKKFGHLLRAFEYGAPPHGGIALGIDRLLMFLTNESSIREVMAFPKTGDGRSLMMDTPSKVDKAQLKELHVKTV